MGHAHAEHAEHAASGHGSLKSYLIGFGLSIVLTVIPFYLVMHPTLSTNVILGSILVMAVVQILVHLVCFLHMNGKKEEKWNTVAFAFTVLVVFLLVGGSVWVMNHAMNNMMPMPDLTHQL